MRVFVTLGPFVREMREGRVPKGSEMMESITDRGCDGIEVALRIREYPLAAGLLNELDPLKISLHSDFWEFNLASPNRYVREAGIRQLIDEKNLADSLGVGRLTFHPGFQGKGTERAQAMELLWDSLSRFQELAAKQAAGDCLLCLENMDGKRQKLCTRPDEIRETLARFPFLHLTCDFAHLGKSGQDVKAFLDEFFDRIEHLHVSGAAEGKKHGETSLKASDVDFAPQLKRFRDRDIIAVIENSSWEILEESKAVIDGL